MVLWFSFPQMELMDVCNQGNPKFQSLLRCQKLHQCYNKPKLVWVNIVLILEIYYIQKNLNLNTVCSPAVPHPHHMMATVTHKLQTASWIISHPIRCSIHCFGL